MEETVTPSLESLTHLKLRFGRWIESLDQSSVLISIVFLLIVYLGRKTLSRWIMAAFEALLGRLSVGLSEEVRTELTRITSVLIVTLAVYVMLEALNLPILPRDIFRRILSSVAVIAVFSSWYNLCGTFVSLLQSDRFSKMRMEAGWMERVGRFGILLFGISALLKVWQVDFSAALTGVGVLGAGLAIAAQDLVRNLIAGMNNMSENRFAVGDSIEIEGVLAGTVETIDLRSTLIRGFDQIPRHVPNSELSNAVVLNYAHRRHRRIKLSIPLVLSSTTEQIMLVRDALRDYVNTSGDFELSNDAPRHVYVEGLTKSAVTVILYAWTTKPEYDNFLKVNERLSVKILDAVEASGTRLAYPTQTVSLANPSPDPDLLRP